MKILAALFFVSITAIAGSTKLGDRPIIFVRGWGPAFITDMKDLKAYFVEDGMSKTDMFEISYPWEKDPDTIRKVITEKINDAIAKYPPGTQFDMVTHSLGGFVGLHSLLESKLASRFLIYVSLAGVAHGQEKVPSKWMGKTIDKLAPYNNLFIQDIYDRNAVALGKLKKCAVYSMDDNLVNNPMDSGAFPDGINIQLPGYGHLDFIHDHCAYMGMKKICQFHDEF